MHRDLWGRPLHPARTPAAWGPPRPRPAPFPRGAGPSSFDAETLITRPSPLASEAPPPEPAESERAHAELESVKSRLERDSARALEATRARLVAELVPVLDNVDRSIAAGSTDEALLAGVKLLRAQLEGVIAGYGLERIHALGAPFDPALHEAVAIAPVSDEALDGVVTDELSRGYRLGERAIVPARVRVGKLAA